MTIQKNRSNQYQQFIFKMCVTKNTSFNKNKNYT